MRVLTWTRASSSPSSFLLGLLCLKAVNAAAPSGPWDAFNFAPESRTVYPASVRETVGSVTGADGLVGGDNGSVTLEGDGSYVVLDFGKEVSTFRINHPFDLLILTDRWMWLDRSAASFL